VRARSANLPIALATAYLDSVPFLAVTGNVPTSQLTAAHSRRCIGRTRRLSVDGPQHLQARVPADARRAGAAGGATGLEDHGDGTARACSARRAVRRVPRSAAEETPKPEEWSANISSRCGADPDGVKKPSTCDEGRAAGDPRRPGREVWRGDGRPLGTRREAANPGWAFDERIGAIDTYHPLSLGLVSRGGAYQRTARPGRPMFFCRWARASTTAPRRRGFPATRSPSRRPSSFTWTSIRKKSAATIRLHSG